MSFLASGGKALMAFLRRSSAAGIRCSSMSGRGLVGVLIGANLRVFCAETRVSRRPPWHAGSEGDKSCRMGDSTVTLISFAGDSRLVDL